MELTLPSMKSARPSPVADPLKLLWVTLEKFEKLLSRPCMALMPNDIW
jgi:hypothetical protein